MTCIKRVTSLKNINPFLVLPHFVAAAYCRFVSLQIFVVCDCHSFRCSIAPFVIAHLFLSSKTWMVGSAWCCLCEICGVRDCCAQKWSQKIIKMHVVESEFWILKTTILFQKNKQVINYPHFIIKLASIERDCFLLCKYFKMCFSDLRIVKKVDFCLHLFSRI